MGRNDERGTVSAVGLCVLTTVLLLAFAAAQFMRGGASVAAEYEREMQLRLAAESGVETAVARLERTPSAFDPLPDPGVYKKVDKEVGVNMIPVGENIELCVFVRVPMEGTLDVIDVATDSFGVETTRIPDGENWDRAKIVHGRMEKKGDRYVWRRWY